VPNSGSLVNHTRKSTRINTVFDRRGLHDIMERISKNDGATLSGYCSRADTKEGVLRG
jgi:hypothetical protein